MLSKSPRREKVVLSEQLDVGSKLRSRSDESGEVDVGSYVGGSRLVERVRPQVVGPIGPKRPIPSARSQVFSRVAVVDDEKRSGRDSRQHVLEPGAGLQLDLDPAARFDRPGKHPQPLIYFRPRWRIDECKPVAIVANPPFPPSTFSQLGDGHREVVDQLVGDDDAADRIGKVPDVACDSFEGKQPGKGEAGGRRDVDRPSLHGFAIEGRGIQQRAKKGTRAGPNFNHNEGVADPLVLRCNEARDRFSKESAHLRASQEVATLLRPKRVTREETARPVQSEFHEAVERDWTVVGDLLANGLHDSQYGQSPDAHRLPSLAWTSDFPSSRLTKPCNRLKWGGRPRRRGLNRCSFLSILIFRSPGSRRGAGSPTLPRSRSGTGDRSILSSRWVRWRPRPHRLKLGTGITLVAQRDPIWLAKEVATLDHLSGGRVIFGIGYGWNKEEMASHGVAYPQRRAILREKILMMKSLWTEDVASFKGELLNLEPSWAWPKPVQKPHPPIIMGGAAGPRTIGDMVEFCDGWMPLATRHDLDGNLATVRSAVEAAGRDPASFNITTSATKGAKENIEHLIALGVDRIVFNLPQKEPAVVLDRIGSLSSLVAEYS